jgi:hypothetical protein
MSEQRIDVKLLEDGLSEVRRAILAGELRRVDGEPGGWPIVNFFTDHEVFGVFRYKCVGGWQPEAPLSWTSASVVDSTDILRAARAVVKLLNLPEGDWVEIYVALKEELEYPSGLDSLRRTAGVDCRPPFRGGKTALADQVGRAGGIRATTDADPSSAPAAEEAEATGIIEFYK